MDAKRVRKTGGGWNKGRKVGKKRAFTNEHVQLIRVGLRLKGDLRGLALFETALSTLLRSSDLLALVVDTIVDTNNEIVERFEVTQIKTGQAVKVRLSEYARAALRAYLVDSNGLTKPRGSRVWSEGGKTLGRLRYSILIKEWARMAHADPRYYSTHSMRRTMAAHAYRLTQNHEVVRQALGHKSIASTSEYLDIERDSALDVMQKHQM